VLEFDFQSPSITLWAYGQKMYTELRVLNFGFGLAKNTPANHVLIFRCKLKDPRTRLFPITFENVIFAL